MKMGFNLLLWTTHVTQEHIPLLGKLKKAGYDGVEVPVFAGDEAHFRNLGRLLRDQGLECTAVTVIPDEAHNPISPDASHRQGAVDHLKSVLDRCAAMGAEALVGPYHQPLGVFSGNGPTEDEKNRAAAVHRTVAGYAQDRGVLLAIECLNRFECYFLNTMADGADYVKRVNHPNFAAMYDTFHANIEEKDPVGCIRKHAKAIRHVHISENDRGTPGRGHVPWADTFKALRDIKYDGWLVIEAFGRALPDLAAATRVWRDFFASPQEVYTKGIRFMKQQWLAAAPAPARQSRRKSKVQSPKSKVRGIRRGP